MTKALSVLLPCFDAEATLEECLSSVLTQSFEDFEILAIDDGSSDNTAGLLERHARRDDRLRVFRRPHRGIAASLTEAVGHAKAPLLARMDADDRCHRNRFELQIDWLETHPGIDVLASQVQLFPRDSLRDGYLRYETWSNGLIDHQSIHKDLLVESPIAHPSVVMRRSAVEAVGGYRDNGWPEDYDLWMRLVLAGYRFHKLERVLLYWRDSEGRASRVDPVFADERFEDVKQHYLERSFLERGREVVLWGAGPVGKKWARRLESRGFVVRHFVELDERKIGNRIYGAEVISNQDLTPLEGRSVLVAVGALSRARNEASPWLAAREDIRRQLVAHGFEELRDFVCVA